jgi:hypothetical protein
VSATTVPACVPDRCRHVPRETPGSRGREPRPSNCAGCCGWTCVTSPWPRATWSHRGHPARVPLRPPRALGLCARREARDAQASDAVRASSRALCEVPLCAEGVAERCVSVGGSGRSRERVLVARADWPRRFATPPRRRLSVAAARDGQAMASWCRWSLRRLWVAVSSRHSDLTADRPRRWKRSAPRLDLIWPKTGSTLPWRLR